MTDTSPRIPLLDAQSAPPEVQQILKDWPYNLHRTLAHNPQTLHSWMTFGSHILINNTLPERDREIAILRVAWNCQCNYEWGMHARLARSLGFTDEDLIAIARGPDDPHWSALEVAILRGVDELQSEWTIVPETWAVLSAHYEPQQLIDYVFVIAEFVLVAMALNAFRVPLEEGVETLPVLHD